MSRVTLVVNRHDAPSETFQRALAATLARAGHDVTVHALRAGPPVAAPAPGVALSEGLAPISMPVKFVKGLIRHRRAPWVSIVRRAWAALGAGPRAARATLVAAPILASDPDIVHLGFSGIGLAIADALALFDRQLIVVSCRGTDELVHPVLDPTRRPAMRALFTRVDAVHAVADAVATEVVAMGASPERVRVIRPAVDLDAWVPGARSVGPPFRVLAVGRLEPAKGHDDLIGAVAAIRAAGVDVGLEIVGEGRHRDALTLRIERLGLSDAVTLAGPGTAKDVREALGRAHLFVLASLSEGINNGVLEAMASGVAVISTNVGGMSEVITDGRDGWMVPPGRPDRLAATMASALADPDRRAQVAEAGRTRVQGAYTRARQDGEWTELYDELATAGDSWPPSTVGTEGTVIDGS